MANQLNSINKTEIVNHFYQALNQNEILAIEKLLDPQIERIENIGYPPGMFSGITEVLAHISSGRGTWAEGTCQPERLLAAGDKVIACNYIHVRLKNKSDWIEGRTADVFGFRNGKIVEFHTFEKETDAFKWAGVTGQ